MLGIPDMSVRAIERERMDAADCPQDLLLRTVDQFELLNRLVARYRTLLAHWVLRDMLATPDQPRVLADLGAGGGDIAAWLLAAARRHRLRLRVEAWDCDARIVAHARRRQGERADLVYRVADALTDPIDGPVDYLFANHFLHHLTDAGIIQLLQRWAPRVRRTMILSDLHRHAAPYAGYALLTLLIGRRSFAREDGLLSIRRGFRASELTRLAADAGLADRSRVQHLIPGRLALIVQTHPGCDRMLANVPTLA